MLVLAVGIGAALGGLGAANRPFVYAAEVRLDVEGAEPRNSAEATVLSSKALAIATSRDSLDEAAATAQSGPVAPGDVTITSLGSSGVLKVEVTNADPAAAARQANALAGSIIDGWDAGTRDEHDQAIAALDAEAAAIETEVTAIDKRVDELVASTGGTTPANDIPALTATLARREELVQRAAALELQRHALDTTEDSRPRPRVLQTAAEPTVPEPRGVPLNAFLGAVLAGLAAVTLAAVVETVRPSVVGVDAQAEAMATTRFGSFQLDFGAPAATTEAIVLVHRIVVACRAQGLSSVWILGLGRIPRSRRFKARLLDAMRWRLEEAGVQPLNLGADAPSGSLRSQLHQVAMRVAGPAVAYDTDRRPAGVVVFSGPATRRTELDAVADLHNLDGTTILGLATFDWSRRWWPFRSAPPAVPAPSTHASPPIAPDHPRANGSSFTRPEEVQTP